jgi:Flp pilus assembly protein TadG
MMLPKPKHNSKSGQSGLAVVEFAIILPFIVLVALAVTELGRGLYQYNTLTKAVRDGSRYLADVAYDTLGTVDIAPHVTDVQNLVVYGDIDGGSTPLLPGLSTSDVSVTAVAVTLPSGGVTTNHVEVTADFNFVPLFPALSALGYSMIPTLTTSDIERALTL